MFACSGSFQCKTLVCICFAPIYEDIFIQIKHISVGGPYEMTDILTCLGSGDIYMTRF